jgi:hypothetical protein
LRHSAGFTPASALPEIFIIVRPDKYRRMFVLRQATYPNIYLKPDLFVNPTILKIMAQMVFENLFLSWARKTGQEPIMYNPKRR